MKKIVAAFLLFAATARAEPHVATIPPGDDVITSLKKGGVAPYDGQLFGTDTAIRWGLWLQQYRANLDTEIEHAKATCTAQLGYKDSLATIESDKSSATMQDLITRIQRSETARLNAEHELASPPWYRSGTFQFTLGVLSTVLVGVVVERVVH